MRAGKIDHAAAEASFTHLFFLSRAETSMKSDPSFEFAHESLPFPPATVEHPDASCASTIDINC